MSDCALYRLYDKNESLLYVGISINPVARFMQHKSSDKNIVDVSRMDVAWFLSEAESREAERVAIMAEAPLWNKQRPRVVLDFPRASIHPMSWRTFAVGNVPPGVYDFFFDPADILRVARLARAGDRIQIGVNYFRIPSGYNVMRYVLERASKLTGMEVKAHHLKRRYGNRWDTGKESSK